MARDRRGRQPDEFDELADAQVGRETAVGRMHARGEQAYAGGVGEGLGDGDEIVHGPLFR